MLSPFAHPRAYIALERLRDRPKEAVDGRHADERIAARIGVDLPRRNLGVGYAGNFLRTTPKL
jgi:hypothetical protein